MKYLSFVFFTLFLVSCTSIPKASPDKDMQAKKFETVKDKAVIYVYRNEYLGAALSKTVTLDGKLIGITGAHTYIRTETTPGKHTLNSNGESMLEIDVASGKIYYVRQEIKVGIWSGGSKLMIMDETAGRKGVLESSLIGMQ